jgi:hypothetical protein
MEATENCQPGVNGNKWSVWVDNMVNVRKPIAPTDSVVL